jgi:hypothetical protein
MIGSSRNTWDFEPRSVPGCGLWLDAADSSAVTIATGVSGWRDKSSNAYNLTQSTTGNQPSYSSSLITFSNNTYLNIPQAAMNNLSTWSLFFVINPISSSNWIMAKQKDGANTYNVLSMTYNTTNGGGAQTGSNGFLYWRSLNNAGQLGSTAAISTSTLQIWNLTYDGTSLYFYKNGVLEKTTSGSFAVSNDTSATNFTLGVWIQSSTIINSGVTNFRLGEMILYSLFITDSQRQQIEGYLARKWNLFNFVYSPTIPLTISGCGMWLDGNDPAGTGVQPSVGATVSTWVDKSGNSNNGTSGASTFQIDSLGGYINFTGGSSETYTITNTNIVINQYFTVFIVEQLQSAGSRDFGLMGGNAASINNNLTILYRGTGTMVFGQYGNDIYSTVTAFTTNATQPTRIWTFSFTPNSKSTYLNGTLLDTLANDSYLQSWGGAKIGWYYDTGRLYIGKMREILIYSGTFTTSQRQTIENYLALKWGFQRIHTPLVSTHPFFSVRPFSRQFNPVDIPDCALWLDGANQSSIILSGSNVTEWRDKSGNNRHATQSTSSNRPVYSSLDMSVDTTTNPHFLNMSNMPAAPYDIFVVGRPIASTSSWRTLFRTNTADPGMNPVVLEAGSSRLGYYTSTGFVQFGTYTWSPSTRNLLFARMNSTKTMNASLNGDISLTANTAAGTASDVILYMGALVVSGSVLQQWGNINEVIFYTTPLTTSQRQQVEGYLAYKWGLISSLPSTHPFKKLQPSSALPFSPTGISGCSLWLDPADVSTVTLNGSNVSQLRDKSGLGYHMSQTTSANQPTYSTSLNGNRMLTFTQSSSTRLSNTSFPSFIGSGSASYFLVEYNMSAPSGNPSPFGYSAGANFGLIMQYNPGFTGGLQPFSTGVSSFTSATPRLIFLYKVNVGSSNMIGFINGTSQTVSDTTSGTYSGTFSVGSGPNGFISGNICELIVFNKSITTFQRQQVEGYLADKWGVKSSLPSTHPYRSFSPSFLGPASSSSGDYSNFLWTRFYNLTGDPSINGPGSSGWGSLIGTAGAYNPINYQDGDSRIGQSDFVGVISRGFMYSATATVVTFRTISDDGIVVIFNGSNVLQNWTYHGDTTDTSASVILPAGYTPIELRFFEWGGGFTCELSWSIGSTGSYVSDGTSRMYHTNASKT